METVLEVKGMTCKRCEERVSQAPRSIPGITQVAVDWRRGSAHMEHEAVPAPEQLVRAVADASWGTSHQFEANVKATTIKKQEPDKKADPSSAIRRSRCC